MRGDVLKSLSTTARTSYIYTKKEKKKKCNKMKLFSTIQGPRKSSSIIIMMILYFV